MTTEKTSIKSVSDLIDYNFFIPSYQRGYRWTEQQTTDLLNDIFEFQGKDKTKDEWYCMQPLIVQKLSDYEKKKRGLDEAQTWYEVIDGQQRLTTLYLIITYLNIETERKNFVLSYETRKESVDFLNNIKEKQANDQHLDNIDFFYIYQSYKRIGNWLKDTTEKTKKRTLTSDLSNPILNQVKFIWYEFQGEAINTFTRINSGKIPLTNAELIKALFLNSSNFEKESPDKIYLRQLEIAKEWDQIEYTLQNNTFWYFITDDKNKEYETSRIGFIFNLMAEAQQDQGTLFQPLHTFYFFYEKLKKEEANVNAIWRNVKTYFQIINEWFIDRDLYHKIGYLLAHKEVKSENPLVSIANIIQETTKRTKTNLKSFLDQGIKNTFKNINIDELEYGKSESDNKKIRQVLLLYNVLYVMKDHNNTALFPFDSYKKQKWDIEHIHAIATNVIEELKTENERKEWLKNNFVKTNTLCDNDKNDFINNIINEVQQDSIDTNKWEDIIYYVLGEEDNSIANLCLLDSTTNRSYKNHSFKAKRTQILKIEHTSTFLPQCTKNIFMKALSTDIQGLELWNPSDKDRYIKDIKNTLNMSNDLPQNNDL